MMPINTSPAVLLKASSSLLVLNMLGLASVAAAQTGSSEASAVQDRGLQEIVVTATKREQSINSVGTTITAFTGEILKERKIASLADMSQIVPALTYTNNYAGVPVFTLRGVGFYDESLSGYPTVSTYVDQVSLPFPPLTNHVYLDIERVEILKGPQGTLFGQNSTGGAINFIAAKPTPSLEAGAELTYGRFNRFDLEGYVSGPISDTLSARLALRTEQGDGWQVSATRPGDRNGKVENYIGRLTVDWNPTDTVKFELRLNGWKDHSETLAAQHIGIQPVAGQDAFVSPAQRAAPFASRDNRAADWDPGRPRGRQSFYQAALRGDINMTDDVTLTSLSSYLKYRQNLAVDPDGMAAPVNSYGSRGFIRSFSQELRLANSSSNSTRWVAGGYFETTKTGQTHFGRFDDAAPKYFFGAIFGLPIQSNLDISKQRSESYAGFANIEQDVGGAFTLKAGGRYTQTNRAANLCNTDVEPPFYTGRLFFDVLAGGAAGPFHSGDCYVITTVTAPGQVDPPAIGMPGRFIDTLHQNNFSWTVGVDWKPAARTLFYLNIAKGYKAGSYPTAATSTSVQYLPVTQEALLSYEGGFKLTLADTRVQFNGSMFYYDYKNKQLLASVNDPVFGILPALQNIPKSSVLGAEIDLTVRPTSRLTFNASGTWQRARIDDFIGINSQGLAGDYSGTPMPNAPKWSFAANTQYRYPINDDLSAFVGGSVNYRSKTILIVAGDLVPSNFTGVSDRPYGVKAYALVDARAGVEANSGSWRFEIWGKNIFDKYYWTNTYPLSDSVARLAGTPRTYGVTVAVKFK